MRSHRLQPQITQIIRLLAIGLIGLGLVLVLTPTESGAPRPVVEVITYTQPDPNPYHRLYEEMLYPTVRITSPSGIGSGVVIQIPPSPFDTCLRACLPCQRHRQANTHRQEGGERGIYILTAAHVVGDFSEVQIEIYNEISSSCPWPYGADSGGPNGAFVAMALRRHTGRLSAFVAITDTNKDLALLCASAVKTYRAKLAPRDYQAYLFTPVYAIGCSLGLPTRPSEGIITALEPDYWEISSPILPGNSGGGVFLKSNHQLIGIAVWVRLYDGQLVTTMAGVVPIQTVYEFLESIESKESPDSKDSTDPIDSLD